MAREITAKYLNANIDNIESRGFEPVTRLQRLQQEYNWILVPTGRGRGGHIYTHKEAVLELHKHFPKEEFTKEQYQEMLNNLYEEYGDRLTLRGEKVYQKENMIAQIEDEFPEYKNKANRMSTNNLKEIFREAKRVSSKKGSPNYSSNNFTVNLGRLLEEFKTTDEI